ncbi:hypothetical protein [Mycobacterium sp. E2497]|uniref:hypothetical protein n=1 Tax=Mycobacterium sp. E2497 TaxID=1834135 RepID=UPI000800ED09|nr:hypothetical protein [Mycobacterium sp. E2497]OBI13343.1 hypothetical protein A5713_02580 [Mycobacterium sp. E2497]
MDEQLDELAAEGQQMAQLLQVAIEIGADLELDAILHRIVAAADDRLGRCFCEADEVTVRALASAASVAIDNARLFDRVRAGARWTDASREISTALLSESCPGVRPLQLIVERTAELTGASGAELRS